MSNIFRKHTGPEWASEFGFKIVDPKGWDGDKQFLNEKISKIEFLNRAACSVIDKSNLDSSRRNVSSILKKLKSNE